MLQLIFLSPHSDPQADLGEPDSGGQCVYEHQLAQALSALPDTKVTTFCRQTYRRPDESVINTSYTIKRLHCGPKKFVPKEEIEGVLPEFTQQLSLLLKTDFAETPPILHAHYWDGGYAALHLKSISTSKLPMVWTPHSLGNTKRQKFPGEQQEFFYNFIPRLCWESYTSVASDAVILSSEKEKELLIEQYAISSQKVHVIPPGVDFSQLKAIDKIKARQQFGFPTTGRLLLCLGRITKSKGYHHAINALVALQKLYTEPVYLAICGGSAASTSPEEVEYLAELKQHVQDLNVTKHVIFHHAVPHEQINQLFSAADVFLMSSEHEPFGLVTIEAMAMKVPVVAANVGGPATMIVHNQTGCLVNFHDPERVATYILSLLKDDHFYTKVAQAAHKYAVKTFDWYHKATKFSQVYRQISRFQEQDQFQEWIKDKYFLQQHFKV